jgi:hypothetical protein
MAIYDFFLSRNGAPVTAQNYVGHTGRLFYDSDIGEIRISDGVTAGGQPIPVTLATTTTAGSVKPGAGFTISSDALLTLNAGPMFELDNNDVFQLKPGTATRIGGIRPGPGVTIDSEGILLIDTAGLPFAFGDFSSLVNQYPVGHPKEAQDYALLRTVNENEDAVLASNGTGAVKVVGEFRIYPTNGSVGSSMLQPPVFQVSAAGDISASSLDIQETSDLGLMAALNVTINADGLTKTPMVITGSVAQFTGRDNRTAVLVLDTYGLDNVSNTTGGEFVFRSGRGTNAVTAAVQAGDRLGQVVAAGWASNGYGGIGVGGLRILANENYTSTARGSKLELFATPNGTVIPTVIATVDGNGIVMSSGKNITGTVSTANNLTAASSILTGSLQVNPANVEKTTASVQNFMLNGLTTNHKVVITAGTAMSYGIFISAAWASAPDTLSVEFQNFSNNNINLTGTTIQYFAWV